MVAEKGPLVHANSYHQNGITEVGATEEEMSSLR
jgi:hypothetical protein